jgi:hypothetical protein
MSEDQRNAVHDENLLSAWMKSASDFWGSMLRNWSTQTPSPEAGAGAAADGDQKARSRESFEAVLKTWKTLSSVAGETGGVEAAANLGGAMPDILLKLVQSSWKGFFHLQQQWLERAGRIGRSTAAYSFENIDQEALRTWTEIYEREFSQFLSIPQLGLTRLYQERFNQFLDKSNRFQATFTEFLYLFYLPMEKSFKVLQDEVERMAADGKIPDNHDAYYKMWIKILEGHYMALFKSPEYVEIMRRTLDALEQLLAARDANIQDILRAMAVPTQQDLDGLYREMYLLNKIIRALEKKAAADAAGTAPA